ncbi:Y-family DNA polymerase [Chromatocurvus halotolerans]|uniref:Protein ImuB n=1 Tax=Chromatocurvus halotolerans TaxID=1132028 RepID=A0A4R2KB75_9GAMM|nr:DNA polymerase Y family protein [Chromatocurvus halotolerans]TCO70713.1 protein ImuB [Chromatocurvus halotolerans]
MLWLCLRFNRLSLQCLSRDDDAPRAVVARQRLLCMNDSSAACGLQPGMGIATARTLCGEQGLQLLERDPAAEARCLQELCCWAYGITPNLYPWRGDCLLLEIGGSLRLFGGLHSLLRQIDRELGQRRYHVNSGVAATPKAAWLLTFAPTDIALDPGRALELRLAPLPLSLLAPLAPGIDALERAGLRTLGDLLDLPASALGKRCGQTLVSVLGQITGRIHDREADFRPPSTFSDSYLFGYDIGNLQEMQPAITLLLQSLQHFLHNTQQQTREIHWHFICADRRRQSLSVRASEGMTSARHWRLLTTARMERQTLIEGVETIVLESPQLECATQVSADLFGHADDEPLESLPDRLRNRLGLPAVQHVAPRSEHLPEFAVQCTAEPASMRHTSHAHTSLRPFWLLPQPQPARQQDSQTLYWNGLLTLVCGPERIEDGWWHRPASRDYFVAKNALGEAFWVFFDRIERQWFVHGIFD